MHRGQSETTQYISEAPVRKYLNMCVIVKINLRTNAEIRLDYNELAFLFQNSPDLLQGQKKLFTMQVFEKIGRKYNVEVFLIEVFQIRCGPYMRYDLTGCMVQQDGRDIQRVFFLCANVVNKIAITCAHVKNHRILRYKPPLQMLYQHGPEALSRFGV